MPSARPQPTRRGPSSSVQGWLRVAPLVGFVPSISGCAPRIEISGAYFPAWLLSALMGGLLTASLRALLVTRGLDAYLQPAALTYPAIFFACTTGLWLGLFSG